MHIYNKTDYDTRTLRQILYRVADQELNVENRKATRVTIEYSRGGWGHSGHAYLRAPSLTIKVPGPQRGIDPISFAFVAGHEMAHTRGMDHRQMKGSARYDWSGNTGWRDWYGWAEEYIVLHKIPIAKPVEDKRAKEIAHAEQKVKEARTRLKRATTILAKWDRVLRRLQKTDTVLTPAAVREKGQ